MDVSAQATTDVVPIPTTVAERATYWTRKRELDERKRREREQYEAELDAEFNARQNAQSDGEPGEPFGVMEDVAGEKFEQDYYGYVNEDDDDILKAFFV